MTVQGRAWVVAFQAVPKVRFELKLTEIIRLIMPFAQRSDGIFSIVLRVNAMATGRAEMGPSRPLAELMEDN